MDVVIFDIFAPYGHFRVPYTTTSPITYPVPPKTAIAGMISAIVGLDKSSYLTYFQNSNFKVGIQILNPIKMITINENFINVKVVTSKHFFSRMIHGKSNRTQINVEFLKDPAYRLFVHHENREIFKKLEEMVKGHRCYYSICMGLSESLANFNYIGTYSAQYRQNDTNNEISLHSVLPLGNKERSKLHIRLKGHQKYLKIHIPVEMKPDRELLKTEEVLIERDGKTIDVQIDSYFEIVELKQNIVLF